LNELKINPEYEALLPKLPPDEFEALKVSIKESGLHYPIVVNKEGIILDGHHRFRICQELDIKPKTEVKEFSNRLLEKKFVIESNLRRRHLNTFQRARLVLPLLEIEKELARIRQLSTLKNVGEKVSSAKYFAHEPPKKRKPLTEEQKEARRIKARLKKEEKKKAGIIPKKPRRSSAIVAKKAKISDRTLEKAKIILEKGSEDLKEKVESGKMSISSAYRIVKSNPKPQINTLNELTGGEWLQFTKSWFIFDALDSDLEEEKIVTKGLSEEHPATFSPTMVSDFIRFFTKKDEVVLDPFVGIGSTLVACSRSGRKGIGIDINEEYTEIARKRVESDLNQKVICGNSWEIEKIDLPYNPISYCITSPPYYKILDKIDRKQKERIDKGLNTNYSKAISMPDTVNEYINRLVELFSKIAAVTKEKGFLTVILQNFWEKDRSVPLAWQFTQAMIERGDWKFKGERIWCQAHKKLLPYGQKFDFMPNVHHHYCLVFRK
jgi:DNA modification methylase